MSGATPWWEQKSAAEKRVIGLGRNMQWHHSAPLVVLSSSLELDGRRCYAVHQSAARELPPYQFMPFHLLQPNSVHRERQRATPHSSLTNAATTSLGCASAFSSQCGLTFSRFLVVDSSA